MISGGVSLFTSHTSYTIGTERSLESDKVIQVAGEKEAIEESSGGTKFILSVTCNTRLHS